MTIEDIAKSKETKEMCKVIKNMTDFKDDEDVLKKENDEDVLKKENEETAIEYADPCLLDLIDAGRRKIYEVDRNSLTFFNKKLKKYSHTILVIIIFTIIFLLIRFIPVIPSDLNTLTLAIFAIIGAHAYSYDEKFNEGFSKAFKEAERNIKEYISTKISPSISELSAIQYANKQLPDLVEILNRLTDDEIKHLFLNKRCRDQFVGCLEEIYPVIQNLNNDLHELGGTTFCCADLKECIKVINQEKKKKRKKLSEIVEGKQK